MTLLTPAAWLDLVVSEKVEAYTYLIMSKVRTRSRSRRPYQRQRGNGPHKPSSDQPKTSLRQWAPKYSRDPKLIEWKPIPYASSSHDAGDNSSTRSETEASQHSDNSGPQVEPEPGPPKTRRGSIPPPPLDIQSKVPSEADVDSSDIDAASKALITQRRGTVFVKDSTSSPTSPHRGRNKNLVIVQLPKGLFDPIPESTGVITVPFFTWPVRIGGAGITSTESAAERTILILTRINDSILSNELRIGVLYAAIFQCTLNDLVRRYDSSSQTRASAQRQAALENALPGPTTSPGPSDQDTTAQEPPLLDILPDHQAYNQRLLYISQDIVWRFIPKGSDAQTHAVCKSFWGSVDDICRVRTIHTSMHLARRTLLRAN